MKKTIKLSISYIIAAFLLTVFSANSGYARADNRTQFADNGPVSINVFYQSLSPYGRWINYPQYGQVWIPNVSPGFEPYSTSGQWIYTDYGWTWASDYSWGWAPFHYGRWLLDDYYGWVWVPGSEWAPAWVAWRNSSDYFGWAPLGPGINVNINFGIPAARWVFIPRHYFGDRYAYRYYVPRQRNTYIIHNTTIINNTNIYHNNRYFSGPSRVEVEHSTRRAIRPMVIADAERPGVARVSSNRISIYRPTVQRSGIQNDHGPVRSTTNNAERNESPSRANTDNGSPRVFRSPEANSPSSNIASPERSGNRPVQRSAIETPQQGTPAIQQTHERQSSPQAERPERVFRSNPATERNVHPRPSAIRAERRSEPAANVRRESSVSRESSRAKVASEPRSESSRPDRR